MSRDAIDHVNRIALLATGDEIIHGDILNSNSQTIAQKLFDHGMRPGLHMSVGDNIEEIEQAITYLLKNHRALIITGGLGPTSDDITRYALAKACNLPLIFDEITWQAICARFKLLGYTGEPPEGNRQQALFPQSAAIIKNPNGTAAGCYVHWQDKWIFMLPGPPPECLPMVDHFVLPKLFKNNFQDIFFYDRWLLFGVSESVIAEQLDNIVKSYACTTGYRITYPYIEFKIYSHNKADFKFVLPLIKKAISPFIFKAGKKPASTMLQEQLLKNSLQLIIFDQATGGLLENTLKTPNTARYLNFYSQNADVEITGLNEYWQNLEVSEATLEIHFPAFAKKIQKNIPLRGRSSRVKSYAVELICQVIALHYENHPSTKREIEID